MSQISQIRKCYNCGAVLQSTDPTKEGYVNKEVLENGSQNFLFCNKCFEVERYQSKTNEPVVSEDLIKIVEDAKAKQALLVYVINLFSFEASFSHQINEIINGMNILVVANKFDLMPKGTNEDDTREYVAHRFRACGVHVEKDNIVLANAFDDDTARNIIAQIYELKNGKDVYVIGSKLAGKTTLIDSFLRVYNNLSKGNIVSKEYPGTKQRVLQLPLSSRTMMYEIPSIPHNNSILYNLDANATRKIYVTTPVEYRDVSLRKDEVLYFGGMSFVELLEGKKTNIRCFFANNVQLKHHSNRKAEERFVNAINKKAIKPFCARVKTIKDMDVFEIKVTESNYRDIGIQGLGWFNFLAKGQTFRIYVPKGVSIYTSRPKIDRK
jgi:ribosome biogenesis GTPase A